MLDELRHLLEGTNHFYHLIKIDGNPELEQRYGARVPVLAAGDRELCEISLDRESVKKYLNGG